MGNDRTLPQGREPRLERNGRVAPVSAWPKAWTNTHRAASRRASSLRMPVHHWRGRISGSQVSGTPGTLHLWRLSIRQSVGTALRLRREQGSIQHRARDEYSENLEFWNRTRRISV